MSTTDVAATSTLFPPRELPDDLVKRIEENGWREDLARRLFDLRFTPEGVVNWLENDKPEDIERWLSREERLHFGTLRGRSAHWNDQESFAELWANSPETIGDWEVTVERTPYPFAQYALHENVSVRVIVDRNLVLACGVVSFLNAYVAGRPMGLRCLTGWRVRRDFRGGGFTHLLQHVNDPPTSRWSDAQFFYVRTGNVAAERWMEAIRPGFLERYKHQEDRPPGDLAEVQQYPARRFEGDVSGIRKATPDDVARCVALVNRTHAGLDLFRPYTREFLHDKLTEWSWAVKPSWWTHVYSWDDYWVLERDGRVVACAGLWDRGRDMREVWRHTSFDETRTIAPTALLDFGCARGREDELARLIAFLVGRTAELGRDFLLAPLQWLPKVRRALRHLDPVPERRGITWNVFKPDGGFVVPSDPPLGRAFIDLAYW